MKKNETEISQAETQQLIHWLQEANANLVKAALEKEELAQEKEKLLSELKSASGRKDEFLAMLGHELRNPLSPISAAIQILKDQPYDESTFQWALAILDRNINHINRLVDELLEVSRITRGLINIQNEKVELTQLIKDAIESVNDLIQAKQQTVNLDLPPEAVYVNGDPVRLIQIFVNLLNNAAKYNHDNGQINLSVRIEGTAVIIVVGDSGMGIEPQLLPHIFEIFTQGTRGLDRSLGGLGLGLTLVKNLVNLHKGEITAHSEGANKGSEFVVKLPLLTETEAEKKQIQCLGSAPKLDQVLSILIIDDNPDVAEAVSLWLGLLGHQVEIADNGLQGIQEAEKIKPDIILIDIGLPDLDGYKVAKRIREISGWNQQSLLIAVSGYAPKNQKDLAKDEAGFDHYLVKPPNLNQLKELISDYRPNT